DGTDPRVLLQWSQAKRRILDGLESVSELPQPIVSKEEIEAYRLGPKYLGNIRPPGVVAKISSLYPEFKNLAEPLVSPLRQDEDVRARIQELCLILILAGFARDKGVAKDDPKKSEDAAQSQFRDISHICGAVVCDFFITADKRCAKLAYTVFEALNLKTGILHLVLGRPEDLTLGLVGVDYWP
ncbi:MAG TPA: hypothetical protein VK146_16850, partial [Tabrizicola sp.]|nr:hypothetical protein [Tabrizicola sp.]